MNDPTHSRPIPDAFPMHLPDVTLKFKDHGTYFIK